MTFISSPLTHRIMASFYYFLPGVTKDQLRSGDRLNRPVLAAAGIDQLLADVVKTPQHVSLAETHRVGGPWETTGTMLALVNRHTGVPELVVPDFTRQTWKKRDAAGKCWVGCLKGDPPLPEELERWEMIPGWKLSDAAKYEWLIPVARMPDPNWQYGHLPQTFVFDAQGEPEGRLQPSYQWLWDLAGQIRNWYVRMEEPAEGATVAEHAAHERPPFNWLVKQAGRILGVNYRVGLPELTFLHELGREVLSQTAVHGICQALFGFEVLEEAKKKQPDEAEAPPPSSSSSTTGGETLAASPGTGPVGEG